MSEIYTNSSHALTNEALEQAYKIKGWGRYDAILYMAQRARMLGPNGKYHENKLMSVPMVESDSFNKTSIVIEEMAAGKFFEV